MDGHGPKHLICSKIPFCQKYFFFSINFFIPSNSKFPLPFHSFFHVLSGSQIVLSFPPPTKTTCQGQGRLPLCPPVSDPVTHSSTAPVVLLPPSSSQLGAPPCSPLGGGLHLPDRWLSSRCMVLGVTSMLTAHLCAPWTSSRKRGQPGAGSASPRGTHVLPRPDLASDLPSPPLDARPPSVLQPSGAQAEARDSSGVPSLTHVRSNTGGHKAPVLRRLVLCLGCKKGAKRK